MNKIFKYELKRLIGNKVFIALLLINGAYAWYVLSSSTLAGAAYTAPFSVWSFGAYLAQALPVSLLTVLFLLSLYHSNNERQTAVLTSSTPANPAHYALVRCGAVGVCFAMICGLLLVLSACFYVSLFGYRDFRPFALPALLILPPCFAFTLGLGSVAGRIHPGLLYALMPVVIIPGVLRLNGAFDFFGGGYLGSHPLSLPIGTNGEPAFVLGAGFWMARGFYLVLGGTLLWASLRLPHWKARKA